MNEWKKKQEEKNKLAEKKTAPAIKPTTEIEESGVSSSMSAGGRKGENIAESYTSDDFEDTSMSGSGSASTSGQIQKLAGSQAGAKPNTGKPASTLKKIEESSDIYEDDEFESLSKSQQQMNQILPVPAKKLPTVV